MTEAETLPCERCWEGQAIDFCPTCRRDLCACCMEQGCCGHQPAQSGAAA